MKPTTTREPATKGMSWVIISAIAFLLSVAAAVVLIFFGKRLEDLGITNNIYYIILIPLGFSAAAFLAGAMKSYASFKSNASIPYGQLNMTGPVVIFALVVGGGFVLPSFTKKDGFEVKFRVVSDDKATPLFNDGKLILYIGMEPKTANIRDGEASFYNIPVAFHNKEVKISPLIENYQLVGSDKIMLTKNESYIDIKVERTKQSISTEVRGSIINEKDVPVKGALINFASGLATCKTDDNGDFAVTVPVPSGQRVPLKIIVDGASRFNEAVTISATTPINLKLEKNP